MQVPVYNANGEVVKNTEHSDAVFGISFNEALVHQAVLRQQANARQGTSSTKTRGEVAGSTRKLYRQKHTGESRAGSIKSPLRRGGGNIFGPKPRDYRQDMPKKMRQAALRCVLSDKVASGDLKVLDEIKMEQIKTKGMIKVLMALGVQSTAVIADAEPQENLIKSARNLAGVKTLPANLLNVVDIMSHKSLLMTESAVRKAEQLWGGSKEESSASV